MYYQAVFVTLTLRVMRERQTPKKLKLIKCFSCSRWRLWYLLVCKNKLKLNRQKWGKKEKSLDPSKTEKVCVCCFCIVCFCGCEKSTRGKCLSSTAWAMNSWQIRWLSKIAAQQWAGVFINSGLAAVTVPLLHHSSEPALCCVRLSLGCCHTDSCC